MPVVTIGRDVAKAVFQMHGVDEKAEAALRWKLAHADSQRPSAWRRDYQRRDWCSALALASLPERLPESGGLVNIDITDVRSTQVSHERQNNGGGLIPAASSKSQARLSN